MFPYQLLVELPTANGLGNLIAKDTPQIGHKNFISCFLMDSSPSENLGIDDDGGDVDAEVKAGDDDHAELKMVVYTLSNFKSPLALVTALTISSVIALGWGTVPKSGSMLTAK